MHAHREEGSEREEHPVRTPLPDFGLAQFDGLLGPFDMFDVGLWVTDRDRARMRQREVEHRRDIEFISRSHHRHVREDAHVRVVEDTVMRRSIGTGEATAIETERDGQVLQRDLLEDVIEAALKECAVDVHDRAEAALRHPSRKRDRVCLANAGVEEPRRELLAHATELVPLAHRGGQDADLLVGVHRVVDRVAHDVRVRHRRRFLHRDHFLPRAAHNRRRSVVQHRVFAGRIEPLSLLREDVQQDGAAHFLDHFQRATQRQQVVPIDRPDVSEAHLLEEHSAVEEPLHRVLQLRDRIARHLADDRQLVQQPVHVAFEAVVKRGRPRLVQVLCQPADARADPHLVVVQNDEQVFLEFRRVVHRFKDDARRQRSVADHRDRFATALPE